MESTPLIQSIHESANKDKSFDTSFRGVAKHHIIIVASMFIALASGSTNAFNRISVRIQSDFNLADSEMSIFTTCALIGMFFTLPVGYMNDSLGSFRTGVICSLGIGGSYVLASFTSEGTTLVLLAICLLVVGFSGGGTFVAALSTAIRVSPPGSTGLAISLVGGCMSLSLGFTVLYLEELLKVTGCSGDTCWVQELRYLGIGLFIIQFPAFFVLWWLEDTEEHAVYHVLDDDEAESAVDYARLRNATDYEYTVEDNAQQGQGKPTTDAGPFGSVASDPKSRSMIDIPDGGKNQKSKRRIDFTDESLPRHYKSTPNPSYGTPKKTPGYGTSISSNILSGSSGMAMSLSDDSGFTPRTQSQINQVAYMKPVASLHRSSSTAEIPVHQLERTPSPPKLSARKQRAHSTSDLFDVPKSPAFSHEPLTMVQSLIILQERYFWFMVLAFFAGIGSGLFIIGNTVQLVDYFDSKVEGIDVYVSLVFSVMNGVGTVASGALSDYMAKKYDTPPSKILGGSLAMMGVLQLILGTMDMFPSSGILSDLVFGTCMSLVGVGFGSCFTMFPNVLSELYGQVNFGKYFGYLQIGSTVGTFTPMIFTFLHDATGNFSAAFFIMAVSCLMSSWLTFHPPVYEHPKDATAVLIKSSVNGDSIL